ncbi:hypothetical protein P280DRAFT_414278 [Massarina eburnea CBS 473.64]|uniref:BYS1 domain protein n=1 Tax=Massarina eburnea CBS 473.64 TaxID=1395130 RepID=A0A6A6RFL5_9PLEO|nr:hypothetical protein P280DRAFT_414278 [Massarina eburnea CBS 473.64]
MRYIISLAALATSVSAVGNAVVLNKCPFTIYAWSVSSSVGNQQTIATGGTFSEAFHHDDQTGGIAIKITKEADGLYTGAPQQIFSYSLDTATVWYDLSTAFGEPFSGSHITVTQDGSRSIDWPTGSNPGGSQVKAGVSEKDVVFTACA